MNRYCNASCSIKQKGETDIIIAGLFSDSYLPILDGVTNVVRNHALLLDKKDCKCLVVAPKFPHYTDNEDIKVLRYFSANIPQRPPYRLGIPVADQAFLKKMHAIPFDIVHAHSPFITGRLALQIGKKKGIPKVATFHSKFYDDFKVALKVDKIAEILVKRVVDFYNSMDYVWTVNKSTAKTLQEYGFKGDIEVLQNGTDFTPKYDRDRCGRLAEERLDIHPEQVMLLYVGQHIIQKNLHMLVNALDILRNMNDKYKMVFVGDGCEEENLKRFVQELGLQNNVIFTGRIYDRDFLKALYVRASLLLFPSLYDNSALVIKEAAAVGCPAVVIQNSNTAEGIVDTCNGFTSLNDPVSFAEKVACVLENPDKLNEVGKCAQKTLYISWNEIVDEVITRYTDIIRTYENINRKLRVVSRL